MARKAKKMLQVEKQCRQPLEELLPRLINEKGLTDTANELGLSKATLGYWLLKLQIRVVRVALKPDEEIRVTLRRD